MKYITTFIMAMMLAFTANAGQYAVISAGVADMNVDTPFNQILTDDDSEVLSITFGTNTALPWLDVELEYAKFSDISGAINESYPAYYGSYDFHNSINYEGEAATAWLVAKHELIKIINRPLTGYVRAGVTMAQSEAESRHTIRYVPDEGKPTVLLDETLYHDDTGIGLAYGVGLMYNMDTEGVTAITVDYKQYDVGMVYAGQSVAFDPRTLSLGVRVNF